MKVGLYCPDKTGFPNYALMAISSYHKQKGDIVEWYNPLWHDSFDKIYCSSCFDFSNKDYVTDDMIYGGAGFGKDIELPPDIRKCDPDYSIYPDCDFSIVWFDIGCPRNCPFCINNNNHREINRLTLNPNGKYIKVMDDNFFYGDWQRKIEWLLFVNQPTDIQNVDAKTFKKECAYALLRLKHHKQIKMAWDNPRESIDWEQIAEWIPSYKVMVYVLIGYWSTQKEDYDRVIILRDLGFDPFVMPYNKSDLYQKDFTRWVNHKAVFKTVDWKDYNCVVS